MPFIYNLNHFFIYNLLNNLVSLLFHSIYTPLYNYLHSIICIVSFLLLISLFSMPKIHYLSILNIYFFINHHTCLFKVFLFFIMHNKITTFTTKLSAYNIIHFFLLNYLNINNILFIELKLHTSKDYKIKKSSTYIVIKNICNYKLYNNS